MRKWIVGTLVLLAVGLLAGDLPVRAESLTCRLGTNSVSPQNPSDFVDTRGAFELDPYLVFFELPGEFGEGTVVEFEFLRQGVTLMIERVILAATGKDSLGSARSVVEPGSTGAGNTVVEVLSTSPAERARLRNLAAHAAVAVEVRVEGQAVETLAFADLERRSWALLETLPQPVTAGALLIIAGAYQLTPLKQACLTKCRNPLAFFMSHWREEVTGALRMGLHHGAICIGCCWALMGLMFVFGAMNLAWMAGLGLLMLLEKTAPGAVAAGKLTGLAMALAGAALVATGMM